jgi:flavin reductase (DIM6/NTAB) family NADH-FMN oxidoreductase RutF
MKARHALDADAFREALGRFASGVTVVTTRDADGRDRGMTVSAFSSLSLHPPLVLACIGHDATIAGSVSDAEFFGVSVLADDQEQLSRRFADPDADRFDGVPVSRAESGVALLDGALTHLECRIVARHAAGDHTIIVGQVLAASGRDGRPLVHHRGRYGRFVP